MLDPARTRNDFAGFKAGVDLPLAGFYKDLMEVYPDASERYKEVRDIKKWYTNYKYLLYLRKYGYPVLQLALLMVCGPSRVTRALRV